MAEFDLAIIGGGVNGAGIARDAAGRGVRVLLIEQDDLAGATSGASTKLIHGGLRYLEHGALRLVREALAEREVLLRMAPHLVRPLRFVLPHHRTLRPPWMLRLGLFVYDHLGGRKLLPPTRTVKLASDPLGVPLRREFKIGYEYSDCQVDDARLVVLNALDAAERGATIRTRTRCVRADRADQAWRLVLNGRDGREIVTARVLVNATGPWVAQVSETILRLPAAVGVRLVKGSHIVVPRLFEHDRAYLFQHTDQRIVFAIPYERDFTLIGTTDLDFDADLSLIDASPREITYLCRAVSAYLREPLTPDRVVWSYAGVRPLYDDGAARAKDATRDYVLTLDAPPREAPLLTVYGGKITTYRRLAEEAMARIARFFMAGQAWTGRTPLPGGDFAWDVLDALVAKARQRWPFLGEAHVRRLLAAYGTRIDRVLGDAKAPEDLGPWFGHDLCAAEIRYLVQNEWAETAADVLWRRSKLGLRLNAEQREAVARFISHEGGRRAAV